VNAGAIIKERQELLRRVLSSAQFAQAESLRRILQYLAARSQEGSAISLKEHEIAVSAMGRPATFDPKTDPIVRVSIASIRERLRTYFDGEGRDEPLRLVIPKGQYRLCFVKPGLKERTPQAETRPLAACKALWEPYLSGNASNILIYSELLFFRDERGNYVRNIYVNDLATAAADMQKRFPEVPVTRMEPSFHFVPAGEAKTVRSIQGLFRDMGVPLEVRISRFVSWSELQRSNLILIGGSRTNMFLNALQGNEPFVMTADSILNIAPQPGEDAVYGGQPFLDGKLERRLEYAVVTRRPGVVENTAVTLIAANHARANEGAGAFLTRESNVASLLEVLGSFPPHFQVLLRVDMIDFDEEVVNVEYLTHRVVK
jgi:hypothetical protein